jgi:putative endonuclease
MVKVLQSGWGWVAEKLGLSGRPLGRRGERYAATYLKRRGFRIVARNRMLGDGRKGEIDLIAIEGTFLVFVEVRTRTSESYMTPEESIRHDKRRAVVRTVRRLIRRHKTAGLTPRIDVVAIIWPVGSRKPSAVRHHRGVLRLEML